MSRLVVIGSVIGDQMMTVPHLPERGGDVLAGPVAAQPGGAYNIVAAAIRMGLDTAVAGRIGTGPIGSLLTDALAGLGAPVLIPRSTDGDSGTSIGFIEPDGERTFVTSPGVEQAITDADLAAIQWRPEDLVYLSGYDLLYPETGPAVARWLDGFTPAGLLLDPGPLIAEVPAAVLDRVLASATVFSMNEREAAILGQVPSGPLTLWDRLPRPEAVVLVRVGADGAWLHRRDREPLLIESPPVEVVDSTGAGDAHAGALLALLAEGLAVEEAVLLANAAAGLAVTVLGSATGPTRAELFAALEARNG